MIRKTTEFEQATLLRKRGFTYEEIARVTNVSKSTVSNWLSRETWSQDIKTSNERRSARENKKRISLLNTARANQNHKLYTEAVRSAVTEFKHYKSNPLFVAGIMVYITNGDHSGSSVIRLTSAQIRLHRIFVRFMKEYLGIQSNGIRFWLLLNKKHSEEKSMRAWSRALGISITQFHKNQIAPSVPQKTPLHSGVGNTIIGDTVSKKKLMKWSELMQKEL